MAESEQKQVSQRFINSIALACQVSPGKTMHVQIVICADDDDKLHCYFDVVDPDNLPKIQ